MRTLARTLSAQDTNAVKAVRELLLIVVVRVLDPHQAHLRIDHIEIKQLKGWRA